MLKNLEREILQYELMKDNLTDRLADYEGVPETYKIIERSIKYCDKVLDKLYKKFDKVAKEI